MFLEPPWDWRRSSQCDLDMDVEALMVMAPSSWSLTVASSMSRGVVVVPLVAVPTTSSLSCDARRVPTLVIFCRPVFSPVFIGVKVNSGFSIFSLILICPFCFCNIVPVLRPGWCWVAVGWQREGCQLSISYTWSLSYSSSEWHVL